MSADLDIINLVGNGVSMGLESAALLIMPIVSGVFVFIPSLLRLFGNVDVARDSAEPVPEPPVGHYDFIVVGAGTAGSVVANRLSEHFNVLLLERGGEPHPLNCMPVLAPSLLNYPESDYMYRTVPQSGSCLGLNGRQSSWSRGKGLGGSSLLNLMVFLRGHPRDYDNWANLTKDCRWSYDNLLPFFKKSEDYCFECEAKYPGDVVDREAHSVGGPQKVGKPSFSPLVDEFLDAAAWDGIPTVDLNSRYTEGAARVTYAYREGHRWSSFKGYIEPILDRPTLHIVKHAQVYKILIKTDTMEAYGVKYERLGVHHVAMASKEVILSAGAIDSTKILLLSGIGPSLELALLGIQPLLNLPVGRNLQDHLGTMPGPFIVDKDRSAFISERDISQANLLTYLYNGTGTMTTTGIHANAFFSSFRAKREGEGDWPDTQWMFSGVGTGDHFISQYSHAFNLRLDIMKAFLEPLGQQDAFFYTVMLSRPKQRGVITLRSADYHDDPILDPKYFEDPSTDDVKVMVEGCKRAVHISENAPSFRRIGARLSPIPYPSCAHLPFRSDAYWECFTRHYSVSIYHYSGTTAMGPADSPDAVVDPELRVIGAKRLRVIDTGIMPFVVTVNTNAPTLVIGERGVQFILDTWLRSKSSDKPSDT